MTDTERELLTATFGSISSGTMRPEDLIGPFADELETLTHDESTLISEARAWLESDSETPEHADTGDSILSELFDALDELAPEYGYFGARPGDGADFGFWLHEDFEQCMRDDGVEFVSDLADVETRMVAVVSDHGNVTYGTLGPDGFTEIWAVV